MQMMLEGWTGLNVEIVIQISADFSSAFSTIAFISLSNIVHHKFTYD